MVDSLRLFAAEVTRVAKEVGTDGQLGGQAYVYVVSLSGCSTKIATDSFAHTVSTYRENGNPSSILSIKCAVI